MHDILTKYIHEVARTTTEDFQFFRNKLGGRMGAKLQSEIISALLENSFIQHVPGARGGVGDNEADIYLNDAPLELKTARRARVWRGGEYSKRSGDFLLVSWDMTDSLTWCVLHVKLDMHDWKSSGSANYYATTISLDDALARGGQFLIGGVRHAKKLQHPIYERLE